jgi:hypothetical protein
MSENTIDTTAPNTAPAAAPVDNTAVPAPAAVPETAPAEQAPATPPGRIVAPEGSLAEKAGVNAKEDWFLTRVTAPNTSTENLFKVYGVDGFADFKSKEDYWKDTKIQKQFSASYGSEAKMRFEMAYDNSKKEYADFQLGHYQRSQTGSELLRDNLSALRADVTTRFSNMTGTLKVGDDWTMPTKDYRENFSEVKVKEIDENGKESYVIKEYTPELLKELEQDPSFGGLAYSDAFYNLDPNEGVNGLYFNVIHDGRVMDEQTGALTDVRDDQVVSRWDIDTGPTSVLGMFDVNLDRVFKNNKLEADGVLDYAKILVKSPMNMAVNVMDTAVQLTRAAVAGGYGIADAFTDDDLDVRSSEVYKWLTTKGVKLKGNTTSMSREAMQDGFFGSLEAALTTTADVALQIALAGGLGRAGAALPNLLEKGLTGKALQQAQTRSAEIIVRGTLTAMSVKDSYNEAIQNGYSTSEASLITGAMGVAMWKATKYASYIFGDHEVKVLRANIKAAMQTEQQGLLKTLFASVAKGEVKAGETKAKYALESMQRAVSKVFGKITKALPPSRMLYIAREEAIEEMTEELFQDGVKHVASAYGALVNNAHAAGKGRYSTIFDEGYMKDAAMRYLTSGVAGGLGGPMGMIGSKVELSPITSASSMTDILMDGRKEELLSVLAEMKNEGALGPKALSTEYNEALDAFEPMVEGSGSETLADMVFKQYEHDINIVDTFINQGMFGQALNKIQTDAKLKDFVEDNSMRKDFVKLMGNMLEFHSRSGVTKAVYEDLDAMPEGKFVESLPGVLKESSEKLRIKNEEIEAIKEAAKEKKAAGDTADSKKEKKPKTEKKEKKKAIIGEEDNPDPTRFEKEIQLSKVADSEVVTMLSNYRKVRAISTGIAAEHYLMQNEFAENTMLGSKYNREAKYSKLGETPLIDMMMSMRFRSKEDQKIHAYTEEMVTELEEKVVALEKADPDTVDALSKIVKQKGFSHMTEKALKTIAKLYDKADYKQTSIAFDAKNEDSIFKFGADGKVDEADMRKLYEEIVLLSTDRDNRDFMESGQLEEAITPEMVAKYFRTLSKDITKATIPEFFINDEDGKPEPTESSQSLIDAILSRGSDKLKGAIKASGTHLLELKQLSEKAAQLLMVEGFYKTDPFQKQGINALFKRKSGDTLVKESLVSEGLSEVTSLEDSGFEGLYTKSDHGVIDDILEQIDVRLEMAKVMGSLTEGGSGKAGHYLKMLTNFRTNVLDIIDFKYNKGSVQDTEIENHSYKDYTVTSDFFVDFIYDPILLSEIQSKDVSLHTDSDVEVLNGVKRATSLLRPSLIKLEALPKASEEDPNAPIPKLLSVEPSDIVTTDRVLDETLFFNFLSDIKYADNFLDAKTFLESGEKVMIVPNWVFGVEEQGGVPMYIGGVTELLVAKWLFTKTREVIATVADKATPLPYIEAKNRDNEFTLRTFVELIESDDISGLKDIFAEEDADVYLALNKDFADMTKNEMGSLNIKIENILYKIYNNTDLKRPLSEDEVIAIKEDLENHVYDVNAQLGNTLYDNQRIKQGAEKSKKLSILVGALTTDFTPFYAKFKGMVEAMTVHDDITVAAQEHAAKHAGAYLYSPKYKELADALSKHRLSLQTTVDHISAVYVTGVAGSGKSSAVIKTGLKIATEILEQQGYTNTAVLPVSTFASQIEIISKSVGALSKGHEGMSVEKLHKLLEEAVNGRDQAALEKLSTIGIIAIDEATYVEAKDVLKKGMVQLEQINQLIGLYNDTENIGGHKLGLLLLGDPKQRGATIEDEGYMFDTSLEIKRAHPIAYMDFSFRNRNNFIGDSLAAIAITEEKSRGTLGSMSTFVKLEPGTKYGTTAGRLYGVNIVDAIDKTGAADFFKVLNDDKLIANIEANILKTIAANESRAPEAKEIKFEVLIAPSDKVSYDSLPSKLKTLTEKEGYAKYFKVIEASQAGGSEANYVIGEIENAADNQEISGSYIASLGKTLNTLATRAFDYALIVNRNSNIIIPADALSKEMTDGLVSIPDSMLDGAAKEKLKLNYLEILKDIESDTSGAQAANGTGAVAGTSLPGAAPSGVLMLGPGAPAPVVIPGPVYTVPEDPASLEYKSLISFIEGDTALLSIKGGIEEFKTLDEESLDKIVKYLDQVSLLLTAKEEDVSGIIDELDHLSGEFKSLIGEQRYNELMELQIFADSLRDGKGRDPMMSNILLTNIHATVDALTVIAEAVDFMDTDIGKGITIKELLVKIEDTLMNPSFAGIYQHLYAEALVNPASDRYKSLYNNFVQDVLVDLMGTDAFTYNISDENDVLLGKMVNSKILARATYLKKPIRKKLPDLDLDAVATTLHDFSLWAEGLKYEELEAVIKQFQPRKRIRTVTIPTEISALFTIGANSASVSRALLDAAMLVKAKKDAEKNKSTYTDDIKELERLKAVLGIDSKIIGVQDLYQAIRTAGNKVMVSLQGAARNAQTDQQIAQIIAIQNLWNKLYMGSSVKNSENEIYGKGFIYRNLSAKETLDDYIKESDRSAGMYTIALTQHNKENIISGKNPHKPGIEYSVLSTKQALDKFNYGYTADNANSKPNKVPKKVVLRVVRTPAYLYNKEAMDVIIMVPEGNQMYAIAQLNSMEQTDPVVKQINAELKAFIEEAERAPEGTAGSDLLFRYNTRTMIEMEISGDIKNFLFTRPGGIITQESASKALEEEAKALAAGETVPEFLIAPEADMNGDFNFLSLAELKASAAVSNTIYANTHNPTASKADNIANLRGELFVLYSGNKSASLDTKKIKDDISQGKGLDTSNRIQNNAADNISSQLGVMRLSLKAPLNELGKVLKANSDISMGAFTSNFSLALQTYFTEFADANFKAGQAIKVVVNEKFLFTQQFKDFLLDPNTRVGDEVDFNIKGSIRKFTVSEEHKATALATAAGDAFIGTFGESKQHEVTYTKEVASIIEDMRKGLVTYYKTKPATHSAEIQSILDTIKNSKELKAIMDEFAWAFIRNKAMVDIPTASRKYDIIYPSPTGAYIFNINEYLRYSSADTLDKLTKVSQLANYTLKPSITYGNTVYAGTVSPVFGEAEMAQYLMTPVVGIKMPNIAVSKSGVASIRTAIRVLKENKVTQQEASYTKEQSDLLIQLGAINDLDAVVRPDYLISLGSGELAKILGEIQLAESLFLNKPQYKQDVAIMAQAKIDIQSAQSVLQSDYGKAMEMYLSDHVKNDPKSPVRKVLSALILDFEGSEVSKKAVLESLKMIDNVAAEDLVDEILEWSGLEDDTEMVDFLKGCKLN